MSDNSKKNKTIPTTQINNFLPAANSRPHTPDKSKKNSLKSTPSALTTKNTRVNNAIDTTRAAVVYSF